MNVRCFELGKGLSKVMWDVRCRVCCDERRLKEEPNPRADVKHQRCPSWPTCWCVGALHAIFGDRNTKRHKTELFYTFSSLPKTRNNNNSPEKWAIQIELRFYERGKMSFLLFVYKLETTNRTPPSLINECSF
jgi:hypothetical protein